VMIHVGAGDREHGISLPKQYLGHGAPQRFELGVIRRPQGDGHETKITRQILQKRKLHFESVLGLVRHAILAKRGISVFKLAGKLRIDLRAAERRLPGTLGKNGLRLAAWEM